MAYFTVVDIVTAALPYGRATIQRQRRQGRRHVGLVSIAGDQRKEMALQHLPDRTASPPKDVLIVASGLTHVDAGTAIALRGLIEFRARWQQCSVCLDPPRDARVWGRLGGLLGSDL